jgi:hypothetical protein
LATLTAKVLVMFIRRCCNADVVIQFDCTEERRFVGVAVGAGVAAERRCATVGAGAGMLGIAGVEGINWSWRVSVSAW